MVKTGIGQDSHRFEPDGSTKPLKLGGAIIPGCPGLAGNSDADVILHALCNAISSITTVPILGAVTDKMCMEQGITDSVEYVKVALATLKGYSISHIAVTIEAKRPHLAAHIKTIRQSIADIVKVSIDNVGCTATSGEGLTAFGRGEGVAVFVAMTVEKC